MSELPTTIGRAIRAGQNLRGLSRSALAVASDVPPRTIDRIIAGEWGPIRRLAEVLRAAGVSVSLLIDGIDCAEDLE